MFTTRTLSTPMFSTLENTWGHSGHRGWSTLASFTMQALGMSLLLVIPLLTIQGPPMLRWFESPVLAPPPPAPSTGEARPLGPSNMSGRQVVQPYSIPHTIAIVNEPQAGPAPDFNEVGVPGGTGTSGRGIWRSIGNSVEVAPPPPAAQPVSMRPLRVSHWAEGNLIYRVQPVYPPLAQQAHIQGTVELRAIVSKAGTIENLVVAAGHPMLVRSAMEAVRQWRYRPYTLNNEPIEVETEITVNFVLSGH